MNKPASGLVSGQKQSGEVVRVTITPPGASPFDVSPTTDETGRFSATVALDPGVGYTAQSHISNDGEYDAADSEVKTFNVLIPRTITIEIG